MKNSTDNQDALKYAEESTAKVAEALVAESSKLLRTKKRVHFNEEANIVHKIFDALESNNPVNNLEKLDQKHEEIKEHSSISTKIKEFIKSIIKFLKSPFTKHSKAELDKSTDNIIKLLNTDEKIKQQTEDKTVTVEKHKPSVEEVKVGPLSSSLTTQVSSVQVDSSHIAPAPPSLPQASTRVKLPVEARASLMEAIRKGTTLKNVEDQKLDDTQVNAPKDQQREMINELEARLRARKEKSGEPAVKLDSPVASKFAEDSKLFEQARAEKAESQRLAQAAATKTGEKTVIQPNPFPLNLKPGEIPPAPPPPPTGLLQQGFQSNKESVKLDKPPLPKKHEQDNKGPKQFAIDKDQLQDIRSKLKKVEQIDYQPKNKDEGPAQYNKTVEKTVIQTNPSPLNLKPGEIPPAPPPPPTGLLQQGFQSNKESVKLDKPPLPKKHEQDNKGPKQFAIDKDQLQDIRSKLKKAAQIDYQPKNKDEGPAQYNFINHLKNKTPKR